MFLKRIEMQGFKSFADKIVVNFDDPVTGIVGPNGCGKSNISDAIRWVLGEQSVKSMRGSTMTDVIFNGSEARKKVNLAQVTLVFNNDRKVLNSEFEEIEVTRRLYRDTKESEYLINKTACRLRDIHDLVLDTGLGRDSLSIISQGTISLFAEAKPSERRLIFEEAAGVAKYKKRKIESISKLERTKENIDRMQDIVDEISKQVNSLKRAAKKAEEYKEQKERLESIEISFLCKEIKELEEYIERENAQYQMLMSESVQFDKIIQESDTSIQSNKKTLFELDQEIQVLQERVMRIFNDISQLESRKIEIEERRKYTIEVGNTQEKIKELGYALSDAKSEYEKRLERFETLKAESDILLTKGQEYTYKLGEIKEKEQQLEYKDNSLKQEQGVLEHRLSRPYEGNNGIQSVLRNKVNLFGVHNIVEELLVPEEGYEVGISTALAASTNHVVVESDKAAVNAINFLKKNMSGRATFIPLTACVNHYINEDAHVIASSVQGYLGSASDFVSCDEEYEILRDHLLGNVLLVETIEQANILANRLNKQFKIVTLDGDVIHRGGIMSGGKAKTSTQNIHILKRKQAEIMDAITINQQQLVEIQNRRNEFEVLIRDNNDLVMQTRIQIAQIEPMIEVKKAKYDRAKQEYEEINPNAPEIGEEEVGDDVIVRLNEALMEKDEINSRLSIAREKQYELTQVVQEDEQKLREFNRKHKEYQDSIHKLDINKTKYETQIENALNRLSSEYQMTFEYALENVYDGELELNKEEILRLRNNLVSLGNVNLEAPEQYVEAKDRYEFINTQLDDLIESRNKLLNVIEEMDSIMVTQFKEMFDKINSELTQVFSILFGGGKARLILEDPEDLLNTGIDIDVQPPGKSVQNIRLFSGGEKSLIAISVLFAILKARHVPLCIFDEVEAALDQANVERLANYIKNYKEDTQFIIITHRPGTMAQADVLYGVTMPTKGVSSILRVKLEEATKMKEAN